MRCDFLRCAGNLGAPFVRDQGDMVAAVQQFLPKGECRDEMTAGTTSGEDIVP